MKRLRRARRAIIPRVIPITLALGAGGAAHGAVWYVNINDAVGPFNGQTWNNAFRFLEDALSNPSLVPGDSIRVADGTYYPSHLQGSSQPGTTRDASFTWRWNVAILGGYAGDGANPDLRDPALYPTIISGNIGDPNLDTDNSRTLVVAEENDWAEPYSDDWDDDGQLSGVTLRDAFADGSARLGALDLDSPTAQTLIQFAYPRVENCKFIQNSIIETGGSAGGAAARIQGVGGDGVADHLLFVQCEFTGNSAIEPGGAVNVSNDGFGTKASFVSCFFEQNASTGQAEGSGCGGAINYVVFATPLADSVSEIVNCRFIGNEAENGGGAISSKVHNEPFSSTLRLANCLFHDNSAGDGGGAVYNLGMTAEVVNCTLVENAAGTSGGAWYESNASGADVHTLAISNSIVVDNAAGSTSPAEQIHNAALAAGAFSITYSLIDGDLPAIGGTDPGTYTDNLPGSTDPQFIRPDEGVFVLKPISACVEAGLNSAVPCDRFDLDADGLSCAVGMTEPIPYDIRGILVVNPTDRFYDIDGDTIADVDLGAYETRFCEGDIDESAEVGFSDLLIVLNDWGPCPSPPAACPGDIDGNNDVGFSDLLIVLANWGVCGGPLSQAPQSIADCLEKYSNDINKLTKCIEAMILANTP